MQLETWAGRELEFGSLPTHGAKDGTALWECYGPCLGPQRSRNTVPPDHHIMSHLDRKLPSGDW